MKTGLPAYLGLLALTVCGPTSESRTTVDPLAGESSFWHRYELTQPHPRAAAIQRVFDLVRAVTPEIERRRPHLIIVDTGRSDPWALALQDGGIVLTAQAVDLCYRGVAEGEGDSCLGFVLAHELAHLASDHFQHQAAYFAVQSLPDGPAKLNLAETLAISPESLGARELLADRQALFSVTVAGLDPSSILGNDRFFQQWTAQTVSLAAYGTDIHPSPEERVRILRESISPIVAKFPLFDWGVRLLQVGRFDDAIVFLEGFKSVFDGPAVLNDLGLGHLQKSLLSLAEECPPEFFRLRFPSPVVDPDTLARRVLYRGASNCRKTKGDFDEGLRLLEKASRLPTASPTAKLNYCAALVAAGRAHDAAKCSSALHTENKAGAATELIDIQAYYLLSEIGAPVAIDEVLDRLRSLADRNPNSPLIAYNHASIVEAVRGRTPARPLWRRFLELEPEGAYADLARRRLGQSPKASVPKRRTMPTVPARFQPPVRPGVGGRELMEWLSSLQPGPGYEMGRAFWRIYQRDPWRVLYRLDGDSGLGRVVIAERRLPQAWNAREVEDRFGSPAYRLSLPNGHFARYDGFGFPMDDGRTESIVFFAGQIPPNTPGQ